MVVKVLDIKNILQQKETAALSDRCVYGGTLYALRDIGAEINYIMCMAKSESKNGEAFFPKMFDVLRREGDPAELVAICRILSVEADHLKNIAMQMQSAIRGISADPADIGEYIKMLNHYATEIRKPIFVDYMDYVIKRMEEDLEQLEPGISAANKEGGGE